MKLDTLSQLWNTLTSPHKSITSIERRRQSRLLANIALVVMLFQLLTFALGLGGNIRPTGLLIATGSFILGLVVYLLNRNGYYLSAACILVILCFLSSHIALTTESYANIYYVIGVILVSAIFLPAWATGGLFILSVGLQFLFLTNAPKTFALQSFQPLLFTVLISIVIGIFIRHRSGLEKERQAELRHSIAALQKSEARWRSLVENAPDYILELDMDYQIQYTNRTQDNTAPELLVGRSIFDFIPPEGAAESKAAFLTAIQTQKTTFSEGIAYTPTGVASWFSTTISPIIREGQPDGVILMSRDISERMRTEQQRLELTLAEDRVRLLTELIADLSHDLKTPLTIINTSLFLLEKLVDDPQRQQDKLRQIQEQAQHLGKIIQDILTLSTLEKVPQLNLTTVNLSQLANEIEKQFSPVADGKQVSLKLDLPSEPVLIEGDEEALRRSMINLVENALNYTPALGEVTLKIDQSEDAASVEVRDTGIGIASEELPRIFERFYRASQVRKALIAGTGLGLAIVKKTIEMHTGNIDVTSELGKGTVFRISLPLKSPTA